MNNNAVISPFIRSTPEEQGISSRDILHFLEMVGRNALGHVKQELRGFAVLRNGKMVAEGAYAPYRLDQPGKLFSLSKSFAATAVGLAVHEGLLTLDDRVISFFSEFDAQSASPNLAAMRVRHLLTMSTGHGEDTLTALFDGGANWSDTFLSLPVMHVPGTHFVYNSGASYMLSAILQRLTGQPLREYLIPRLFAPLQIEVPEWERCPSGEDAGGYGLRLSTIDIAKFGQLYLQDGIWDGKRLLPEGWVEDASRMHISNGDNAHNDWEQGYGYQLWRCKYPSAYRADGAYGQFCLIIPEKEAVIAMTCAVTNEAGQLMLDLVWKHLLQAMQSAPLPADDEAEKALRARLGNLCIPLPKSFTTQPPAGWAERVCNYRMRPNGSGCSAVGFAFSAGECVLTLEGEGDVCQIPIGLGRWVDSRIPFPRSLATQWGYTAWPGDSVAIGELIPVSSGCWWQTDGSLLLQLRFIDTPFYFTVGCGFYEDMLALRSDVNVFFQPTGAQILVGDRVHGADDMR